MEGRAQVARDRPISDGDRFAFAVNHCYPVDSSRLFLTGRIIRSAGGR